VNFFSDDVRRNPFPLYDQIRSASPVFHYAPTDAWMIFDYEGVKRALSDHEAFSSVVKPPTGGAPAWLVFLDPPQHTKLRALISKAFTPRSVSNLLPRVQEISRELLDRVIERGEMDLCLDYAARLPTMVIAEMIGIPTVDLDRFMHWIEVIMNLGYSALGGEAAARAIAEHALIKEEMADYVTALLRERRRSPEDDLLTRLAMAEVDGERLTDVEILGFFQLLLSAATETTTNVIDNAVLCFLDHPAELARLRASPDLVPSAVEEVVRYRSPGQMMFRQTVRDVEMRGQVIPAGKFVLVMIGSANRDPAFFKDADRFDVGRDPNPHLGFGQGIHFCIGAPLARLESRVALADIVSRLHDIELADAAPWEPRKALHVHGPARLPIRFRASRRAAA
jgi:cytochrome P450